MLKNKLKRQRIIFVSIIFAISIISLILVIVNFRDNIVFFYAPSELKQQEILQKVKNKEFRVGGLVKEGSIVKLSALETEFIITDEQNEILINYQGILPNLFRESQGIVAKGRFDIANNQFNSKELLVKHDENYVPPEIKSLQKYKN